MTASFRLAGACAATAIALLSGCAANVVKSQAPGAAAQVRIPPQSAKALVLNIQGKPAAMQAADWAAFRGEWSSAVSAEASAHAIPFSLQDGEARPTGQDGTLVSVFVNDYHYVSSGARYGLGVFTGNAYIDATVRFVDLKTGRPFGEEAVNTSSSAWQGVFSAMTDKQLQAIAKDIVGDVQPH
jgi:hypothetical protein